MLLQTTADELIRRCLEGRKRAFSGLALEDLNQVRARMIHTVATDNDWLTVNRAISRAMQTLSQPRRRWLLGWTAFLAR